MPSDHAASLADSWRDCLRGPPSSVAGLSLTAPARLASPVALELESIYALVADEITARGPACWASGRCCNFDRAGHRLYVTGLETAYALAHLSPAPPPPPQSPPPPSPAHPLTLQQIDTARAAGGCPFQSANLCTVHAVKPLGCRVYFCDRSAQDWQRDLSERMLREIRALHDRHAIEYRYGEWREMLEYFAVDGAC